METRAKMNVPRVDQDCCTCRDEVAPVLIVRNTTVGDAKRDGAMPSEELLDDRANIRERVSIRESWKSVGSDHRIELCPRFLLDFRMERKRREETLERGVLLSSPIQRRVLRS